jgi:hypothetical protein
MSQGGFINIFALVVNYSNKRQQPCHVTIGIFYVHKTSKNFMVVKLKKMFVCFELCDKMVIYMKDEGANLNTFANTLTNIVLCAH